MSPEVICSDANHMIPNADLFLFGIEWKPRIEKPAQKIFDARKNYPNASYADLYDEISMPSDLRKAHEENDAAVLSFYGRLKPAMSELEMQIALMYMYDELLEHFGEKDDEY